MATRAAIVVKLPNGYQGIYCHNDGYLEYTGQLLNTFYRDKEKVLQLISLGGISLLGKFVHPGPQDVHTFDNPTKDVTVAYHRERGDALQIYSGNTVNEVAEQIMHNGYVYHFEDDGEWYVNGNNLNDELNQI